MGQIPGSIERISSLKIHLYSVMVIKFIGLEISFSVYTLLPLFLLSFSFFSLSRQNTCVLAVYCFITALHLQVTHTLHLVLFLPASNANPPTNMNYNRHVNVKLTKNILCSTVRLTSCSIMSLTRKS